MKHTLRTTILLLLMLFLILPFPAGADEVTLPDLFQYAIEGTETETLPMQLHDAFYADTDSFITQLSQKDMLVQESVCRMVAQHSGGSAEYIQFVLSLFPEYRNSTTGNILMFLLNVKADLTNVSADFTETLFTALRYSDGGLTTHCVSLMQQLLELDPFGFVADIVQEDAEFQDFRINDLAYAGYCWDGLTMDDAFHQSLDTLNKSETLTEAERSFVDRLTAEVTRLEQEAEAYRTAATETTVPPETTLPSEVTEPSPPTEAPSETEEIYTTIPAITDYTPMVIAAVCIAMAAVLVLALKKRK